MIFLILLTSSKIYEKYLSKQARICRQEGEHISTCLRNAKIKAIDLQIKSLNNQFLNVKKLKDLNCVKELLIYKLKS